MRLRDLKPCPTHGQRTFEELAVSVGLLPVTGDAVSYHDQTSDDASDEIDLAYDIHDATPCHAAFFCRECWDTTNDPDVLGEEDL